MAKPIVVVGSINLDLVAGAPRIPVPGETIIGNSFKTFYGGKGANQAVAASRLGHPVVMLGCVGDDAFGPELREALKAAGANTEHIQTVTGSSGVALITTGAQGENSIVVVPGANAQLSPQQLEKQHDVLESAGILLAQLEIPMETVEYLATFAKTNSIPLMLDPAPARALPTSLLAKITWITPNENETVGLLELPGRELEDTALSNAADAFLSMGVGNVVLKLGARGCLTAEGGGKKTVIPAFKVNAVDSTAAGDAFNGAFAVGLMRGYSTYDCAVFASAVAAISVTRAGAQPSMPTAQQTEEFLRANNKK